MKVLVLTSTYPRFEGDPTAPFIELLVRHTAKLGHEMHVVVPEHRDWDRPPIEGDIHYHVFRYSPRRSWTPWGYAQSLEGGVKLRRGLLPLAPVVFASAGHMCRTVASRRAIDVVHAHWVVPNGPIATFAMRRRRTPVIVTVHGSDVTLAERSRWMGSLARRSIRRAAAVTAVSRFMLERAELLGADPAALNLIPLGSELAAFGPDPQAAGRVRNRLGATDEEVLVLGIGRLIEWKGFDHLIDAQRRVRDQAANVRLVIAGDGDVRPALMQQAARLGLNDCVTFVGAVDRDEVPAYYAAADIVAIPSIEHEAGFAEGLGYVALEAQASGTPVVATRVGGLKEVVIDGETGYLVPQRDPGALASAISTLVLDPELRRRLGERARARAQDAPSWEDVATTWIDLYRRVIDSRKPERTSISTRVAS